MKHSVVLVQKAPGRDQSAVPVEAADTSSPPPSVKASNATSPFEKVIDGLVYL